MQPSHLFSTTALVVILAFGAFAALVAALGLAAGHPEGIDGALYLLAFGALLPLSVAAVWSGPVARLAPQAASRLAAAAALGLILALAAARVVDSLTGSAVPAAIVLLVLLGLWGAAIASSIRAAGRGGGPLTGGGRGEALPSWLPVALVPASIAVFASAALPGAGSVLLALLLGGMLFVVHTSLRPAQLLGRRGALALDFAAVALILLLVSDITVYTSPAEFREPDPDLGGGTIALWMQLHHSSFLGPANDLIHGRTMLVDTYSQYGVGSIYLIAAAFALIPAGYGTFGILVAAGLAVTYAMGYAILRLAGCSQLLCVAALAAAIVSSVFDTVASPATFPSLGAQRWLFAYLLVLLAMLALRHERQAPKLRLAMAAVVGFTSIWSFETFVYTAATFAGIAAYLAATGEEPRGWLRRLAGLLAPAAVACLAAHVLLLAGTLAASGELPDWDPYVAFVREYVFGPLNRLPAPPWWPGILVGGLFFASAVAVAGIVLRARSFDLEQRPAMIALAGLTAFGIATLSYAVRFSTNDALLRADLAAVMVAALWIHLAGRGGIEISRQWRPVLAATGFSVAALLAVQGWNDLERKGHRTPLVAALPGNAGSIGEDVSRTWGNPPIDPRVGAAERLLDRHWPGQSRALVLVHPDLSVEALLRSDRVNQLPISYFVADEVIREQIRDSVVSALDAIEPGTLMLTERFYLTPGARRQYLAPSAPALPLERMVIDRIRRRFHLRELASRTVIPSELLVVRLVPRGGGAQGPAS